MTPKDEVYHSLFYVCEWHRSRFVCVAGWEPSLKRLFLPSAETFQVGCFIVWPVLHAAFRSGGTVVLGGSWRYLQTHLAIAVHWLCFFSDTHRGSLSRAVVILELQSFGTHFWNHFSLSLLVFDFSDSEKRNNEDTLDSSAKPVHRAKPVKLVSSLLLLSDSRISRLSFICFVQLREALNPCFFVLKVNGKSSGDGEIQDKQSPGAKVQISLKQEILQLEKRLQDQLVMRCDLEKALGYGSSVVCSSKESSMPKVAAI
ncbi:hypothetical protein B296_00024701 [Ensete ventricosum]|uniref:Ternary complex factor MIP1 leucine-zipper domain-containing protein n=1 Tax=Ensete ventricosum TaxID=4639 RepID=A0A426ZTB4_ENSVE|nr:hypothetical protein B296_00024701 [Ensete ventricosum]